MAEPLTFFPEDLSSRPTPLNSLVASAKRLTTKKIKGRKFGAEEWQNDAWDMFDLVGEHRFLGTTLANRLSQARLFVGRLPDALSEAPVEVTTQEEATGDETKVDISGDASATQTHAADEGIPPEVVIQALEAFGGTPSGRAQMMARMGLNLFVAGEGWLCGIPNEYLEVMDDTSSTTRKALDLSTDSDEEGADIELEDLTWRMLSTSEVEASQTKNTVVIHLDDDQKLEVRPEQVYLMRVWRPHPRKSWWADSPTRSTLTVLRELVGLTMHIGAQIDSRLAGAGVFIIPQSAQEAMRNGTGLPQIEGNADEQDPFTQALIEAMTTPINDRSSASAIVPLVITVPDESVEKFKHISFATDLDKYAGQRRDEAIRRLALGHDAPPELLLGMGGMNHWGAWLVQEDVVTTHIEPSLALICDAITTQYLWPMLEEMGYDEDLVHEYVVWYDVSHLIVRPNRSSDAKDLFDAGAISAKAYRDAAGFEDTDAPTAELEAAKKEQEGENADDRALRQAAGLKAVDLAIANPQLVIQPGLQAVANQVYEVMKGDFSENDEEDAEAEAPPAEEPQVTQPPPEEEEEEAGKMPDTQDRPAEPGAIAASGRRVRVKS